MYLIAFCVFFIIAVPCFFTGCNLAVTSFCPAKLEEFHGHVYDKAAIKAKYKCGSSKTGHYTCYHPYLYVIDDNNRTCEYFVNGLSYRYKSDAKDVLKKYKINQSSMFLYKKHNSDRCIKKENIIASWYAGIIFFGLAAFMLILRLYGRGMEKLRSQQYIKYLQRQRHLQMRSTNLQPRKEDQDFKFELPTLDLDDFVFDSDWDD
jgi:hypothetical protein